MLDGPVEQIIDSTPMLGAAATQDTVRLVRHGVRKLLDAVAVDAAAAAELDRALAFDYRRPGEKPDCRWREKAERERMLTGSLRTPSALTRSSTLTGCSTGSRSRLRTSCCAS